MVGQVGSALSLEWGVATGGATRQALFEWAVSPTTSRRHSGGTEGGERQALKSKNEGSTWFLQCGMC